MYGRREFLKVGYFVFQLLKCITQYTVILYYSEIKSHIPMPESYETVSFDISGNSISGCGGKCHVRHVP